MLEILSLTNRFLHYIKSDCKTAKIQKPLFGHKVLGRSKNAPDNASFVLNADAVVSGGKLYLLCPRFLPSYRVDRILVIDLEAYSVEEVLCLPDAVYNSIAVHEGALYAYNYQGSLDKLN